MRRKSQDFSSKDGSLRRRSVTEINFTTGADDVRSNNISDAETSSIQSMPSNLTVPRVVVNRPAISFPDLYPNVFNLKGATSHSGGYSLTNGTTNDKKGTRLKKVIRHKMTSCKDSFNAKSVRNFFFGIFPVFGWLSEYKIKEWLVPDIISGITSAVYQIPQGLGNAIVAHVPAVVGLYSSLFPGLFYSFFGTSRQTSIGTFTVLALMMGNVVKKYATVVVPMAGHNQTLSVPKTTEYDPTSATEIATAVAFLSGLIQIGLCVLRLGKLGVLISPALANGFTAGCAVQIAISQLKGMFGIEFEDVDDMFGVIMTLKSLCLNLYQTKLPTPLLAFTVVFILVIGKDYVGPRFQKRAKIPLPVDLIVVICATLVSTYLKLNEKGVKIIGNIKTGLPAPVFPNVHVFSTVFVDSISIGMVAFACTFSMATLFAKKYNHKVDANQELLAMGVSNVAGGLFSCIPAAGSLARSSVLESVNCKTQLTTMISCVLMVLVIYFVTPLMAPLPKCVLAASIATAVKGYWATVREIFTLWPISKADSIVWAVTFWCVVIFNVSYGLLAGVITALFSITWRMHNHRGAVLKEFKSSGIYLTHSKLKKISLVSDLGSVVIFRFSSPLFFATTGHFERDIKRVMVHIRRSDQSKDTSDSKLVVDCSSMCFIDASGVQILQEIIDDCKESFIDISLASVPDGMIKTLESGGVLQSIGYSKIYPSIQDAVKFGKSPKLTHHRVQDLSQAIPYV